MVKRYGREVYAFKIGEYVERWQGPQQYRGWVIGRFRSKLKRVVYAVEVDPQRFYMLADESDLRLCDY